MRKTIMAAMAASSLIAMVGCNKQPATNGNETTQTAAASADAINGTWKADINSVQFDTKPDEYLLQSGTYSCKSCTPTYSVAADGAFHAVSLPYADSDSVKVVDAHTVTESSKKGGRDMGSTTMTVSSDGNTLTGQFTDTSTPGAPSKGEFTETRVGPAAPSGAHVISGQWKPTKLSNFNDAALTFTVNVSGDTYKSSSPDGTSYEAKIGGGDVPIQGDSAGTTAAVAKSGDGYQVTRKRDGKVVGVTTYTVGADGKLNGVSENKQSGSTTRWSADKQS